MPRASSPKLVAPDARGCIDSPVVSVPSGSSKEDPQQSFDQGPNQGNQCLPNTQLNAPISPSSTLEDRWTEKRQRALQVVRDINTGQPTPTHEENQMYDWDGQFDETLGLPIQLRTRVSNPGTPPVRVSPKAPVPGGGTVETTVNIGSRPELYPVTEGTRGNGMGEVEKMPSQRGEDGTVPPTARPQPRKIRLAEGTAGQTDPQEVHHQVNFTTDKEGPGRGTCAGPGDAGTQGEPLEPTPYGPPRTEDV